MKTHARMALVLALGTTFAAGCDDGPSSPEEEGGLEVEAAEQFGTALTMSGAAMAAGAFAAPQGGSASEGTATWQETYPCPAGDGEVAGEIAVDGEIDWTYDKASKEADISVAASMTHVDCAVPVEDRTFILNGDPSLDLTANFHTVKGEPEGEQTFSLAGAFTWEDDADDSGRCEVDIQHTYEINAAANTLTGTVSGMFCGHTIDRTTEVTTG